MEQSLVQHFVEHFDHHDPRLGADPGEIFETMRETCPITRSDQWGGFWVISDYETCKYVLQHPAQFTTVQGITIPAGMGNRRPLIPNEADGAEHTRYRTLLNPVFSPARIAALEDKIRQVCDDLIDAVIDQHGCEFMGDIAEPLPTIIFTEMMGLPFERAAQFHEWKEDLMHSHHRDPTLATQRAAGEAVTKYLYALVEERRAEPRDDIMSVLLAAESEGSKLTDEEIVDMAFLLFMAGLDTVTSALGLSVAYLAQHPEQRDRLVKDPELIPSAIEELLRYESIVLAARTATEDVDLGGTLIKEGDVVLLNELAADRDPRQFPDADQVIFERHPNRHLAFGAGPHRCVGSHLARLEMRVLFEQMHSRIPSYRLKEGTVATRHLTATAGIEKPLHLVWDEGARSAG